MSHNRTEPPTDEYQWLETPLGLKEGQLPALMKAFQPKGSTELRIHPIAIGTAALKPAKSDQQHQQVEIYGLHCGKTLNCRSLPRLCLELKSNEAFEFRGHAKGPEGRTRENWQANQLRKYNSRGDLRKVPALVSAAASHMTPVECRVILGVDRSQGNVPAGQRKVDMWTITAVEDSTVGSTEWHLQGTHCGGFKLLSSKGQASSPSSLTVQDLQGIEKTPMFCAF